MDKNTEFVSVSVSSPSFALAAFFEPSMISPEVPQISVISRSIHSPPDSLFENDCYWIPQQPDKDWENHTYQIAVFKNAMWHFIKPEKGWLIWICDEADFRIWDGQALVPTAMRVSPVTQLKSCLRSGTRSVQTAGKLQLKIR